LFNHLTPKIHYNLHSPLHIDNFGPLRALNTLAFEREHSGSRAFQAVIKNYRNSPLSIAKHSQKILAVNLLNDDYFHEKVVLGRERLVNLETVPYGECLANVIGIPNESVVSVALRANIGGTEYQSVNSVVMVTVKFCFPLFAEVQSCIVNNSELLLVVRNLTTLNFDKVRQAFLVKDNIVPHTFQCVYYKDLVTYQPFVLHSSDSCKYVIVRDSLPAFFQITRMRMVGWTSVDEM
jgi:hypothetical protein